MIIYLLVLSVLVECAVVQKLLHFLGSILFALVTSKILLCREQFVVGNDHDACSFFEPRTERRALVRYLDSTTGLEGREMLNEWVVWLMYAQGLSFLADTRRNILYSSNC